MKVNEWSILSRTLGIRHIDPNKVNFLEDAVE